MALDKDQLYSLEEYAQIRNDYRARVMAHKKNRTLAVGDHLTLYFEDEQTIQYQIQEMLRIEKLFEAYEIQEELDTYNPLIPDGDNWKATLMIEYTDVDERKKALRNLIGIEETAWMQIEGHDKVYAIANEDLERTTDEKTSSVHFMRFQLDEQMITSAKSGAAIRAGIAHENYTENRLVPDHIRASLVRDLH